MSAFCRHVLNTAFAYTSGCFRLAVSLYFQTISFSMCGTTASMCSSTRAVHKRTSMANFPTIENGTLVSKSLITICCVGLLFFLRRSFDADKVKAAPRYIS